MSQLLFRRRSVRYGLAVAAVAAGFALRLALTAWVGPGLPAYLTFYPAVMAVALLAGLGPGLVATVLTALIVAYWSFEPAGFGVAASVDRVATGLFVIMGAFMSEIARRYRSKRDEAAAYEREQVLRESCEALRRQAELIDPIRAELIAQEMQRAVRERGESREIPAPSANWVPWAPAAVGAYLVITGALVLLGWIFNLEALKSVVPGFANMKANTALCFALTGLALAARNRRPVRLTCAALLLVVAGATLTEYITGHALGIDQLLFRDVRNPHTIHPGRMVPATAIGFILSSLSLLLLTARSRAARAAQQSLAVGAALTGLFAMLGYLYSVQVMYNFAGPASMALLTSVGLLAAGIGLLAARPDGWVQMLTAGGPGAQLAARLLPVVLLLPVALGWLHRYGEVTGRVESPLGAGLFALAMMLALLAAVWWIARALDRADAARRENETQLRNQAELIDQSGEALIVRELDGAIRSWNRGAELLYGWSPAEAVGQPIDALLGLAPAALVGTIRAELVRTGRWGGELVHITRDGRQLTIDAHTTATRTADGRVLVLENLRDITARKQAEEALRRKQAEHQLLFDNTPAGLVLFDARPPYKVLAHNRYYQELFSEPYRTTGMVGLSIYDYAPAVEASGVVAVFDEVVRSAQPKHLLDFPYQSSPPRQSWFNWYLLPLVIDGRVLALVSMSIEVTEYHLARADLERARSTLEEAQKIAHLGSFEYVAATRATVWSEEEYRIYGLDPAGPSPAYDVMLQKCIHPDDAALLHETFTKAMESQSVYELEHRIVRPDGSVRWVYDRAHPYLDEHGQLLRYVGATLDITERRRSEEILRRDKETFEQLVKEGTARLLEAHTELDRARRLADVGLLAATVAHELRNPLAAISVAAHNIWRKSNSPNLARHVANIDKKVAESEGIINNLLFYSRLRPSQFEKVDILGILEDSIEAAEDKSKKEIPIIRRTDCLKDVSIEADPYQLKEVFVNILNNAHDAVPAGSGEIRVTTEIEDQYVAISIADNGPGIARDVADRIFDPFFSTKARGTGLGLSICRQIVSMHDGEIGIKEGFTDGTCVVVRLPRGRRN